MKPSVSLFYACPMLWVFVSAVVVRLIPELLSFPYPIGYDTVFYGWRIQTGVIWGSSAAFFSTWFFYALAIPLRNALQVSPFVLLKFLAPLIYGVNAAGIYYFARRVLLWSPKYASLAGFLFTFQLASLRLSWDLYRNVFGLGILLFALPWIFEKGWKGFFVSLVLSVLVVFSHELVAVTLILILGGLVVAKFVRREVKSGFRIGMVFLVSLLLLLGMTGFVSLSPASVETNVVGVGDVIRSGGGNPRFFSNYLNADSFVSYSSYLSLFGNVLLLFLILYVLLIPLVLIGFFRQAVLDLWALFLLVGTFHVLLIPFFAFDFWSRLMFMLIYPFTFYAVNGFKRVYESVKGVHLGLGPLKGFYVTRNRAKVIFLLVVLLGVFYNAVPRFLFGFGSYSFPPGNVYFPGVYYANTVFVEETADLIEALTWLDTHLADLSLGSSSVVVQDAVLWWTRLYLSDQYHLFHFYRHADVAVQMAVEQGYSSVFFVWWRGRSSLYALSVPSYFVSVFQNGKFSVYEYNHSG